jgi:hypothetical protein
LWRDEVIPLLQTQMGIRIRFVQGTSLVSEVIHLVERDGWATHVEAVLDTGEYLGALQQGGVAIRPPSYDAGTFSRELIADIPATPEQTALFYYFVRSQVGKPYDTAGTIGLALGVEWRDPSSWFCSELMAAGLEASEYFPRLVATNNHISPRDLLLLLSAKFSFQE